MVIQGTNDWMFIGTVLSQSCYSLTGNYRQALLIPLLSLNTCIFTAPAMLLIESMGRKSMLIVGGFVTGLGALICSVPRLLIPQLPISHSLVIIGYLIFLSSASLFSGPVLSVYLCEICPARHRAGAYSIITSFLWVSDGVIVLLALFCGNEILFVCLAALSLASVCLAGLRGVIESKGAILGAVYTC